MRRVVFDLDDTLIRSDHIFSAFLSASYFSDLSSCLMGMSGRSYHEIIDVIGREHGAATAVAFTDDYLNWYDTEGWLLHEPFHGIVHLLDQQLIHFSEVYVVTNKRTAAAKKILNRMFPRVCFVVRGIESDKRITKSGHLREIKNNPMVGSGFLYLGDSKQDLLDCEISGIDFAGALWKTKPVDFPPEVRVFSRPLQMTQWLSQNYEIT